MNKATTDRRKKATAKFLLRVVAAEQKNGINRPDAEAFKAKMEKQANGMLAVKTGNGYVGRQSLTGDLTDTQPKAFAYTWDTIEEAEVVAEQFGGDVVRLDA